MKNHKTMLKVVGAALIGTLSVAPNTFADNPYGIEYTGGVALGEANVQIDSELIENFTPLMRTDGGVTVTTSNSNQFQTGYLFAGSGGNQCREVKYVTVSNDNLIDTSDGITYNLTQGQYTVSVDFKNVVLENVDNGKTLAVGIGTDTSILYTGYQIYEDANCSRAKSGISALGQGTDERAFVDMIIKVKNAANPETTLLFDNLYFTLTDIDMAQSYKIMNTGNLLEKSRMYALNATGLQSQTSGSLRNMYVADGNYIYSEYTNGGRMNTLNLYDTANVYTAINRDTQEEGLNIVLGFATGAYNGIEYHTSESNTPEEPNTPDEPGGDDTPNDDEGEVGDNNDGGSDDSKQEADEDGSVPVVPNTGINTGNTSATIATISFIGILLGALIIKLFPRFTHRKVDFKK